MSTSDVTQILPDQGATVVLHKNNPALSQSTCRALTERGIGVVDFGMGANLDPDSSTDQAETRAKQTLLDISAGGAYGAIYTQDRETVVVGYAAPRALRFLELEDVEGTERIFPAFQFERFAEVPEDGEAVFDSLQTAIKNRLAMPTLYQPDEGDDELPGAETIPEAYLALDEAGLLRRPDR